MALLLVVAACAKPVAETRHKSWRLSDDLAAFEAQYGGEAEYRYRIGEIATAQSAPEYQAFLAEISSAPAGRRAFIYYEVSSANGLYFFALAVDGARCRVVAVDYQGRVERACRGISTFDIGPAGTPRAIRDPAAVGLVEFEPGQPPRRSMRILAPNARSGLPADGDLIAKVRRVFQEGDGE